MPVLPSSWPSSGASRKGNVKGGSVLSVICGTVNQISVVGLAHVSKKDI